MVCSIKKLLIANRGEIAVRIIRAARELGIQTVQVYSDADAESLAVRMADEAVNIGPAQAQKSYLSADAILSAAKECGADAIHPGYGFFAENADFADAVVGAGMVFVGPSGNTIRMMGDKVGGRNAARMAGVPIVPGSDGRIGDLIEAERVAEEIGFPLMIKASAGGGGRGIRVVSNMDEFREQAHQASTEAQAAFGDGGLYIERFIEKSRHVEVQIMGDGENVVHFYERECSMQRRRQKVWEEAPATMLPGDVREKLCKSAVDLAALVFYKGAGTVEFLYDSNTHEYFFIEMNTRIQVEHPVTEMITGVDLVREMILIAGGEKLSVSQSDIPCAGHAIEVRLNAEDPARQFLPWPGQVSEMRVPGGAGIRFDAMIYPGYVIPPFYDSLLGKLIVWDKDRSAAIARLERALAELSIGGVKSTQPLFEALAKDRNVREGEFDTRWLEVWLESNQSSLAEEQEKGAA